MKLARNHGTILAGDLAQLPLRRLAHDLDGETLIATVTRFRCQTLVMGYCCHPAALELCVFCATRDALQTGTLYVVGREYVVDNGSPPLAA